MLRRILARLLPGTGVRRAVATTGAEAPPDPVTRPRPETDDPRLPRSPYAREAAEGRTIDVSEVPLARPYYRAAELRLLQAERRLALALALEGVDYGPAVIHGLPVPA
ncbi:hypothetical protein [Streptomyces sp. KL118A]|uniref:hypothetical protein n=1 Tax=Streptomyces sp. KL118A TaxID=3045153 RepID=UPI00278C07E1|nr:hypothetical protein [Streptomyces sp. KL118A]